MLSSRAEAQVFAGDRGEQRKLCAVGPPRWAVLGFLIFAAVYLYLIFFVFPHTPIYRDGDGDLYLASARRLFDGEVMYRDFSQFTFPGTEVLYVTLFKLFGPALWEGNLAIVGAGVGLSWLTLAISRKLIQGWAIICTCTSVPYAAVPLHARRNAPLVQRAGGNGCYGSRPRTSDSDTPRSGGDALRVIRMVYSHARIPSGSGDCYFLGMGMAADESRGTLAVQTMGVAVGILLDRGRSSECLLYLASGAGSIRTFNHHLWTQVLPVRA